jgi:hypothetical protein
MDQLSYKALFSISNRIGHARLEMKLRDSGWPKHRDAIRNDNSQQAHYHEKPQSEPHGRYPDIWLPFCGKGSSEVVILIFNGAHLLNGFVSFPEALAKELG